jgi:hypothetical protein
VGPELLIPRVPAPMMKPMLSKLPDPGDERAVRIGCQMRRRPTSHDPPTSPARKRRQFNNTQQYTVKAGTGARLKGRLLSCNFGLFITERYSKRAPVDFFLGLERGEVRQVQASI